MTQVQRILTILKDADAPLSFGELFELSNGDIPKGSLSAMLANLYKSGHVTRELRMVEKGRDVQEYQITPDGERELEVLLENNDKPRRGPRGRRRRVQPKEKMTTANGSAEAMGFAELSKLASRQSEYKELSRFASWLKENRSLRKNANIEVAVLEYLDIDPKVLSEQREAVANLLN